MTTKADETPQYLGHRERLRQRFMVDCGNSMPDYEILELLLTMAIPRRDVKPLAKNLINQYGDLAKVLHAPTHKLLDESNLSTNAIVLLKLIVTCASRISSNYFAENNHTILSNWDNFLDYCHNKMAHKEIEEFRVFFFDDDLNYLGDKVLSTGTINRSYAHPREIIREAIEHKAVYVILAHNHPSGDCAPSEADKRLTEKICAATDIMDIIVYDHLIITLNNIFSMRDAGYIIPKRHNGEEERQFKRRHHK